MTPTIRQQLYDQWGQEDWKKILLLFVFGILFRFSVMLRDLHVDEAFSYFYSLRPISFIVGGNDVHPPLYYLILKPISMIYGNDIFMLRLLSVCFWGITSILVYNYVREKFNKDIAFYTILLLTLSPTIIYYTTQIRMYSLFLMLIAINLITFDRFLEKQDLKNSIYFIIPSVLMAYTHAFSGLFVAVELVYCLLKKIDTERLLITFGAILAASMPSIILVLSVYDKHPNFSFLSTNWLSLVSTYSFLLSPPSKMIYFYWLALTGVIFFAVIYNLGWNFKKLGFYYLFIPLPILMYILSKIKGIYHHRFMLIIIIPLYIIIAFYIWKAGQVRKGDDEFIAGLFIIAFFFSCLTIAQSDIFSYESQQYIAESASHPDMPIIHQYAGTFLTYSMQHEGLNLTEKFIGTPYFTNCGSVIREEDLITELPEKPYVFVNLSYEGRELRWENITIVE